MVLYHEAILGLSQSEEENEFPEALCNGQAYQWNLTLVYARLQHVKIASAMAKISDCGPWPNLNCNRQC